VRTNRNGLVRPGWPVGLVLVPDGEYYARLVDTFAFSNAHGDRRGFSYRIEGGPYDGLVLMQSAARSASPYSRLATILRELLGREPTEDELATGLGRDCLGLSCRIVAREDRNRAGTPFSTVESVARA
jgi:hypothetical protein